MIRRRRHLPQATADPNQLLIEWNAPKAQEPSPAAAPSVSTAANSLSPPSTVAPRAATNSPRRRPRTASSHVERIVARLPVPRPAAASVAAGTFGHDDDGKPIRPQANEIRAITESLAERLVELLDAMKEIISNDARKAMEEQFSQGITMYSLEFGERAALQLEAYVRRQSSLDDEDQPARGRCR